MCLVSLKSGRELGVVVRLSVAAVLLESEVHILLFLVVGGREIPL